MTLINLATMNQTHERPPHRQCVEGGHPRDDDQALRPRARWASSTAILNHDGQLRPSIPSRWNRAEGLIPPSVTWT